MATFAARNGHFWLDDNPVLIQAGEFHYYRTPASEWRHRLGLLKEAGFNAVASYMPWIWHQLEEGVSDLDGHSHPMRDLAGFIDLAAEMDLYVIARPGPYIMAETINEGIPPWVFSNYPQVAFVSQDRKTQNVVSYMHPDFLACVREWYKAIFAVLSPRQITRGGKIIMVQLDNEMGMIQWVRNIIDTNPHTMHRFADYLIQTYGADLSSRYPPTDMAQFVLSEILQPGPAFGVQIVEDYWRFYREYLREYTEFLWAEAKDCGLEVPPVINIHGFGNGGKTFPIGLSQLDSVMKIDGMISATDVYPIVIGEGNIHELLLVNEMTKALHDPEQALFSIEFQTGGVQDFSNGQASFFDLHTRLSVSVGMRAINHYLFCDGENDPVLSPTKRHDWGHPVRKDGTLRSHYYRYPKLSRVLHAYGEDLVRSRPVNVTTIGFLLDGFMTEVNNAFSQEQSRILTHQRDMVLFDFIARGLTLTHRPFDALDLRSALLDPGRTPLLWVAMEQQCDAAVQQKLVEYVKQGGKLVLAGRMCVEEFDHSPCTILKDALEIYQIDGDKPFTPARVHAFHHRDIPVSFVERYKGAFDEVIARTLEDEPVGFVKQAGAGSVLVFGAAMTANTLDDIDVVNQMAERMGCPAFFSASNWVDLRLSRGDTGSFLFVANYQDDPVSTVISADQAQMFGGHTVHLAARRGAILPIDWQVRPGVTLHYATSEITEVAENGTLLVLKADQERFEAEMTLRGYRCEEASSLDEGESGERVHLSAIDGLIVLRRLG